MDKNFILIVGFLIVGGKILTTKNKIITETQHPESGQIKKWRKFNPGKPWIVKSVKKASSTDMEKGIPYYDFEGFNGVHYKVFGNDYPETVIQIKN